MYIFEFRKANQGEVHPFHFCTSQTKTSLNAQNAPLTAETCKLSALITLSTKLPLNFEILIYIPPFLFFLPEVAQVTLRVPQNCLTTNGSRGKTPGRHPKDF
jgi:hypothetical protein